MVCGDDIVKCYPVRDRILGIFINAKVKQLRRGDFIPSTSGYDRIDKIVKKRKVILMKFTLEALVKDKLTRTSVCLHEDEYTYIKNYNAEFRFEFLDGFEIDENFEVCHFYKRAKDLSIGDTMIDILGKEWIISKISTVYNNDYKIYTRRGVMFVNKNILRLCNKSTWKDRRITSALNRKRKLVYKIMGPDPSITFDK